MVLGLERLAVEVGERVWEVQARECRLLHPVGVAGLVQLPAPGHVASMIWSARPPPWASRWRSMDAHVPVTVSPQPVGPAHRQEPRITGRLALRALGGWTASGRR